MDRRETERLLDVIRRARDECSLSGGCLEPAVAEAAAHVIGMRAARPRISTLASVEDLDDLARLSRVVRVRA